MTSNRRSPLETPSVAGGVRVPGESAVVRSSWLSGRLQELANLGALGSHWESSGAAPPNETALAAAREVLQVLAEVDLPPNHIDPSTDEGVCISFRNAERYADIECFNSGDILAVTTRDDEEPEIWVVSPQEIREAVNRISRFLHG